MKRKLVEILLILLFYLIQVTFGRMIQIGGISPNLLIILPVLFGFFYGKKDGMFVGFFAGIMYDLYFSSLFGFAALIFVYVGYLTGEFDEKYEKREIIIPFTCEIIGCFAFSFMSYVGNFLLHKRLDILFFMKRFVIPEVVYTTFVFIIIYFIVSYFYSKFNKATEKRSSELIDERFD